MLSRYLSEIIWLTLHARFSFKQCFIIYLFIASSSTPFVNSSAQYRVRQSLFVAVSWAATSSSPANVTVREREKEGYCCKQALRPRESWGQLLASSYVCLQGAAVRTGASIRFWADAISHTETPHVISAQSIFQESIDYTVSNFGIPVLSFCRHQCWNAMLFFFFYPDEDSWPVLSFSLQTDKVSSGHSCLYNG